METQIRTKTMAFSKRTMVCMAAILLFAIVGFAQKPKKKNADKKAEPVEYVFTLEKEVAHTPIKNQASSGTCWSFSGVSFLESEMLRKGFKDTLDLSTMWVVRNIYHDKTVKYVRMHGLTNLSSGGSFHDVLNVWEKYGMVPANIYQGLQYGTSTHNHGELDRVVSEFGKSITGNNKPTTAWRGALDGILDSYLGPKPDRFSYKGVEYTPNTFAKSLGLSMGDYVSITSYTHHPFYTSFILEIPDNWAFESSYNVPINEFMSIIDNALTNGYSVAWGADVSETGFNRDIATIPDEVKTGTVGSDQERWTGEKAKETSVLLPTEKTITQQMRQEAFDNYETTDDHGLHMVGLAKDQDGKRFYKVKNSWGIGGKYAGYLYVSVPYVQYKTMNIVVHKDAIPASLKEKLNIK